MLPAFATIHKVRSPENLQATARLFQLYAASLPIDLAYQDFAAECASLPATYAPPHGELLLARSTADEPVGCVGLRPLEAHICEMKRLYLLPSARGLGASKLLTDAVIEVARRIGYREMRLDTLPGMTTAIALYERLGFRRIAPYYAPTPDGTVFMALDL